MADQLTSISPPRFAHESEAELARILDFYGVAWRYEPDVFPISWNADGAVIESFAPDFYLPEIDLYVELTTLKQSLVRKKNRKLRRMRQLYPEIRVKLFYARDFRALMVKYGRTRLPCRSRRRQRQRQRRREGRAGGRRRGRRRDHGTVSLHDDVEEILLDSETVANRVSELARELTADYAGRDPVLVSVLKGALVFLADLMRAMDLPSSIDLMEVSSYGAATESSGQVRILKDLSKPIEGRDVIVVEDIIDTGLTLNYLLRYLCGAQPGLDPDLLPARQAGATAGRDPDRLHRLHDPGPIRHRLRPRLRRALPQPALHRRAEAVGLRRRAARGLRPMDGGGRRFRLLILFGSAGDDRLRLPAVVALRRRLGLRSGRAGAAGDRPRGART